MVITAGIVLVYAHGLSGGGTSPVFIVLMVIFVLLGAGWNIWRSRRNR